MSVSAKGRIFASHYQLVVCDDPAKFTEETNWSDADVKIGFAGNEHFRMIGTEADLNDHWVELELTKAAPMVAEWDRITCVSLKCETGKIHVMSVIDTVPVLSVAAPIGDYSIYIAGMNIGTDQLSLGEDAELADEELEKRCDLEWYRIFVVPGFPNKTGRL